MLGAGTGLDDDASGLLELPAELQRARTSCEALGLDDTIFEINLTPNRGDCMSVLGVAREVAVLTGGRVNGPVMKPVPATPSETFPVDAGAWRGLRAICVARDPRLTARPKRRCGCRNACAARDCVRSVLSSTSRTT